LFFGGFDGRERDFKLVEGEVVLRNGRLSPASLEVLASGSACDLSVSDLRRWQQAGWSFAAGGKREERLKTGGAAVVVNVGVFARRTTQRCS
jgi:hypothetical protein